MSPNTVLCSLHVVKDPGDFLSLVVQSPGEEEGRAHQLYSALSVLMKCESDRNLSLLGGPLSWFMTGLLSLIYKAQRVEGGVQFHIPGTIHFIFLELAPRSMRRSCCPRSPWILDSLAATECTCNLVIQDLSGRCCILLSCDFLIHSL